MSTSRTFSSYLHSPIHLLGSIINRTLVSSSSSNNTSCFALSSLTCCCLLSSIFSLLLKYCRPWDKKKREIINYRDHIKVALIAQLKYLKVNCQLTKLLVKFKRIMTSGNLQSKKNLEVLKVWEDELCCKCGVVQVLWKKNVSSVLGWIMVL